MCVCGWVGGWVPGGLVVGACVHVALFIQHATRMCHILTSFVAPLAPPYFLTLSHTWHEVAGSNPPIPVAERSKTRICSRSLAGVASSNPIGVMDDCVVCCK
jgi:hypothetical protein